MYGVPLAVWGYMKGEKVIRATICIVLAAAVGLPATAQASGSDEWEFVVTPYLWAAGMDGDVAVLGMPAEVDVSFGDILNALDGGALIHFEGRKGQRAFFVDAVYLDLGEDLDTPPGDVDLKQLTTEGGVMFGVAKQVQLLVGARYIDLEVDVDFAGPLGVSIGGDESWLDGFAGVAWTPEVGERWGVRLSGDLGAGGSDFTWQFRGTATYRKSDLISFPFGVRVMSIDYEDGGFAYDLTLSGLETGVGFHF